MNQVALCFAKTPGLTPAKTRLAKDIGINLSEELYYLMVQRCLELMNQFSEFQPYIAVNEQEGIQSSIWKEKNVYPQASGSLGNKLAMAEDLFFQSYRRICFWGTDSPSLTINHFKEINKALQSHSTAIIPAIDGGFTLYASGKKLSIGSWEKVVYSSSNTLSQLKNFLSHDSYFLTPMSDLDTYDDIPKVLQEMDENETQGPAWDQLKIFLRKL